MTRPDAPFIGGTSDQYRPSKLPKNWEWVPLHTIARLESGHTPDRKQPEYWNGDVRWVSLQDTTRLDSDSITDTAFRVSELGIANSSARILPAGTVIFSRTATVGKSTILGCDMATSQDFANWVCGDRIHNRYLVHVLRGMERTWTNLMAGSTHNTIYMPDFKKLCILLPPLPEQRQIATIISAWDRAIELTTTLIAAKQKRKAALMQTLLTGKVRLPGYLKSWQSVKLGKLLKEVDRWVEWDDEAMYHLISIRRRSGGMFERERKRGDEILTKVMKTTETGDFVIARMQAVHGAITVTPPEFDRMHISDSYSSFVPVDSSALCMPFLDQLSRTNRFYRLLLRSAYGVTIEKMTFNVPWFLDESITLPATYEEQHAISDILNTQDREIELHQKKLDALRRQKKGLMQQLLTGKVRVNVSASSGE
jgi:type I restriction enzyme S subunit